MNKLILALLSGCFIFYSCIPQQKYLDLAEENKRLEDEIALIDSLAEVDPFGNYEQADQESELLKAYRQIEVLRSTNIDLNRSYQDLLLRYTNLVEQNSSLVNTSGERQYNLQQELSSKGIELSEREQRIQKMERDLEMRSQQLNQLEGSYANDMASRDQRILQLQNEIFRRDQQLKQLGSSVNANLGSFNLQDFTVTQRNGKLYVSLSQELLFSSGSSFLGSNGRNAISSLVKVLNQNPGVDVTIEGHTDTQGDARKNWDLSLDRANAVAQSMLDYGLAPKRISISGRGQYDPIGANNSETGRKKNRRTEIILIPKQENINNLLYKNQ